VNNSERFLLGEAVKSLPEKKEEKRFLPQLNATATAENEAFLKMMEDPLVYIK
jgi:hypothetical protein